MEIKKWPKPGGGPSLGTFPCFDIHFVNFFIQHRNYLQTATTTTTTTTTTKLV